MHPIDLSLLLHRAFEARGERLLALTRVAGWWQEEEPLHQVRVASRRLRAVMRLLDPEAYPGLKRQQKRLESLTRLLGPVRELDVHNQLLEELGHDLPGPHGWAALEHLLELIEEKRGLARLGLAEQLEDLEWESLAPLLALPDLPYPFSADTPADAAWACLRPRVEAVAALLPELRGEEDPAALHQLRIHTKKLRYDLEILGPAFPGDPAPPLRELKELQSILGLHHDAAVLEDQAQRVQEGLEARFRRVLSEGMQALLLLLAQERVAQFDRFTEITRRVTREGFEGALREHLGLGPGA
nr:CHAD domain-containing protein [uncultured Holophaga sp.]